MTYRVELPVFSGPMDLLLHLVKQQEVDIHDVMISTVLDQYLAHVDVLEALDLGDLGDFVVMASTLMEIKSRELLPREEVDLEQELDPKDDLIRRLLEYKRYRDISRRLAGMMERRSKMVEPIVNVPNDLLEEAARENEFDLGSIQIWDLTEAFARLMEETGADKELHFDVSRRTVDYYAGQILERVKGRGEVDFRALFDPSRGRFELIGVFAAMLEMMKQGFLRAHQDDETREVRVLFVGSDDVTVDDILRGTDEAESPADELDTPVDVTADPSSDHTRADRGDGDGPHDGRGGDAPGPTPGVGPTAGAGPTPSAGPTAGPRA